MTGLENESCGNCRFWSAITPHPANEDDLPGEGFGECRRYAPKPTLDGQALYFAFGHDTRANGEAHLPVGIDVPLWQRIAYHPITGDNAWCGDFVACQRLVECEHCGEVASMRRSTRRFCSDKCRTYALRKKKKEVTA
jgi:hypothetical protein